jgi:NitT/TauT family transport system permease protein
MSLVTDASPLPAALAPRKVALRRLLTHLGILLGLLGLLELVTRTGLVDELLFPAPTAIIESLVRIYYTQGNIWAHLRVTLTQVIAGFFAGTTLGILLAVAAGMSDTLRRYMKPYVVILEATPRIAIGPLVIAWFGFGFEAKLVIVTMVCFFPPFVNTLTGMISTDEDRMEFMRSLGASRRQTFFKLMLPGMVPTVMAGARLAMASALGGALVAEFISANEGMGVLMNRYTYTLNMPSAFASLLTLTAVGFLLYHTMEIIEERIVFWSSDAGMQRIGRRRAAAWRRG